MEPDRLFDLHADRRGLYLRMRGVGSLWVSLTEFFFDPWLQERQLNGPDRVRSRTETPEGLLAQRLACGATASGGGVNHAPR
ncbi:hypothetical protein [Prosthecomicrobium sp. N25]|uniref:hypothetical protein n=1 Tax=Prosthecomicrobium sp. N25 TaxID=3129254 RepID=UPI00307745E4